MFRLHLGVFFKCLKTSGIVSMTIQYVVDHSNKKRAHLLKEICRVLARVLVIFDTFKDFFHKIIKKNIFNIFVQCMISTELHQTKSVMISHDIRRQSKRDLTDAKLELGCMHYTMPWYYFCRFHLKC